MISLADAKGVMARHGSWLAAACADRAVCEATIELLEDRPGTPAEAIATLRRVHYLLSEGFRVELDWSSHA